MHPMKKSILPVIVCTATLLSLAACGKKENAPDTAAVVQSTTNEAAAEAAPAGAAAPAPAISANSQKELAEARAAMAKKDYTKAVELLTTLQKPGRALTPEQSAAAQAQMRQLQGSLANAIASGDPNARMAAEKLRAAAAH
jgi:predicted small lipoprotein YifL